MRRTLLAVLVLLFTVQAAVTYAMTPLRLGSVSASGIIDADKATVTAPRVLVPPVVAPLNSFAKGPNVTGSAAIDASVNASVDATTLRSGSGPWMPSTNQIAMSPIAPAGVIRQLYVREGRRVTKGQALARIDATLLRLAVQRNDAAVSQARAQLLIVNRNISILEYKQRQLDDAKAKLADGKSQLAQGRAKLSAGSAKLRSARAEFWAQLPALVEAQLRKILGGMAGPAPPPSPPTTGTPAPGPVPAPPDVDTLRAQIRAQIIAAARSQFAAGAVQLAAGSAQLEAAAAKLATAEQRLEEAERQIAEAKVKLNAARKMAAVGVRRTQVSAHASRSELARTVVRAPSSGIVTDLRVDAGELAFSSQPLMTIAETRQVKLRLYLPPDEAEMIRAGSTAEVEIDTFAGRSFPAIVSLIASRVQFAPSNVSTQRVYLSDVQAVTLSMDNPAGILKPGMPADAQINLR